MDWNTSITGFGLAIAAIGSYAVWYAFEYPLCTMDECAPNLPIAVGGGLAIVVGIGLLLFARNRDGLAELTS